jgi:hypothetical protein
MDALVVILTAINFVLLAYCLWINRKLKRRFKAAFANLESDRDLADTMVEYFEKLGTTSKTLKNLQRSYDHLAAIGTVSLQKIGLVHFNPFRDTGGKQSFVLALLDNHNSGLLLTSIHGREGTRVYIKSIEYGGSQLALSQEEKQALEQARHSRPGDFPTTNGQAKPKKNTGLKAAVSKKR